MCVKNDIFCKINELTEHGVFEIWYAGIEDESGKAPLEQEKDGVIRDIFIPYMMNDALECYIVLKNAVLVGVQINENKHATSVSIHKEGERFVLVAKQGEENTFTIFFADAVLEKKYYEFGKICHFWEKGQEQWSQLVYIIGTMFDKYAFLGAESCNEEEIDLLRLIEFAPFRYHAPAKQLFEELYETTRQGTRKMMELAKEAKDFTYYLATGVYLVFQWEWVAQRLSKMLTKPARYKLYQHIYKRAISAASMYPKRVYSDDLGQEINKRRTELDRRFRENGFEGCYPDYIRLNTYVRVVEEHPFTLMDWEHITFKQMLMVSECSGRYKGINMGFFVDKSLKSYCCGVEEFLWQSHPIKS